MRRISRSVFFHQVLAVEDDFAGNDAGGRPGDQAQQRQGGHGLAAAGFADDAQRFPFAQGKADAVNRFGRAPAVKEIGTQVAHLKHRVAKPVSDGSPPADKGRIFVITLGEVCQGAIAAAPLVRGQPPNPSPGPAQAANAGIPARVLEL